MVYDITTANIKSQSFAFMGGEDKSIISFVDTSSRNRQCILIVVPASRGIGFKVEFTNCIDGETLSVQKRLSVQILAL